MSAERGIDVTLPLLGSRPPAPSSGDGEAAGNNSAPEAAGTARAQVFAPDDHSGRDDKPEALDASGTPGDDPAAAGGERERERREELSVSKDPFFFVVPPLASLVPQEASDTTCPSLVGEGGGVPVRRTRCPGLIAHAATKVAWIGTSSLTMRGLLCPVIRQHSSVPRHPILQLVP